MDAQGWSSRRALAKAHGVAESTIRRWELAGTVERHKRAGRRPLFRLVGGHSVPGVEQSVPKSVPRVEQSRARERVEHFQSGPVQKVERRKRVEQSRAPRVEQSRARLRAESYRPPPVEKPSRLERVERFEDLLSAIRIAQQSVPSSRLEELEERVEELHAREVVEELPYTPQIPGKAFALAAGLGFGVTGLVVWQAKRRRRKALARQQALLVRQRKVVEFPNVPARLTTARF